VICTHDVCRFSRLRPLTLPLKSLAGLELLAAGFTPSLADPATPGNTESSPEPAAQFGARKTRDAFVPPNPNELDSAA
jgi:hypothetical protein